MAKDKKYKGGPDRKSYLSSMAKQGGRPMGEYTKTGDYDPKDVHDSTIDYTHRGREISLEQDAINEHIWARELVNRTGRIIGSPFRHRGSLYKIKAGVMPGSYLADPVKT